MSDTLDSSVIHDAPALISVLLSPSASGVAHWNQGELHVANRRITPEAIQDLLTLDVGQRPDVPLLFGREDLTGTLAVAFDRPTNTWTQALDSFFRLWRQRALPPVAPERLADSDRHALDVLTRAHRRLLSDVVTT